MSSARRALRSLGLPAPSTSALAVTKQAVGHCRALRRGRSCAATRRSSNPHSVLTKPFIRCSCRSPALVAAFRRGAACIAPLKHTPDGAIARVQQKSAHLTLHKSTDNGLTWRPAATAVTGDFAERCLTGDGRAYEVGLSADHDVLEVSSIELDGTAHATQLAPQTSTVYALAC